MPAEMVQIDGSLGEGGGQVLRSSLTLSLLTGRPLRIERIRAGRKRPGLAAQHLAAAQAAAAIGGAELAGAALGSTEIAFRPAGIFPGRYHFDIGSAGAASLVLQTLFLPLALAPAPSQITIVGGTHVPWSPCFEYLQRVWLPALRRLGFVAELTLERAGFFPRGGGQMQAQIHPAGPLYPLEARRRGELQRLTGLSAVANLPGHILRRQAEQLEKRLAGRLTQPVAQIELPAMGAGTVAFLYAVGENGGLGGFTGLGERGKPAERVADEAVNALQTYLASSAAFDPHLADQILLPLALIPGSSHFTTSAITPHLLTHAAVIRAFLPVAIEIRGELGRAGEVRVNR